eukprot:GGOE01062514.1.p1 GENE.GGOE01062514.1~~GGOE01062514.1.p1  ORF type:complete len:144 (-),score=6.10 GGOE01062514.1:8-439(-)
MADPCVWNFPALLWFPLRLLEAHRDAPVWIPSPMGPVGGQADLLLLGLQQFHVFSSHGGHGCSGLDSQDFTTVHVLFAKRCSPNRPVHIKPGSPHPTPHVSLSSWLAIVCVCIPLNSWRGVSLVALTQLTPAASLAHHESSVF